MHYNGSPAGTWGRTPAFRFRRAGQMPLWHDIRQNNKYASLIK